MICGYLKPPASSTGSLTVKSPGPELAEGRSRRAFVILANAGIHSCSVLLPSSPPPERAEGRPRRAFVILANAGIHSLQLVSLWIAAYAGMTEK